MGVGQLWADVQVCLTRHCTILRSLGLGVRLGGVLVLDPIGSLFFFEDLLVLVLISSLDGLCEQGRESRQGADSYVFAYESPGAGAGHLRCRRPS